jgi:hypothetical protein
MANDAAGSGARTAGGPAREDRSHVWTQGTSAGENAVVDASCTPVPIGSGTTLELSTGGRGARG